MDGEEDDRAHHLLRVYSKRNYAFAGQKEDWVGGAYTSVDSAWMGNIARYLNHAEPFKWPKEGLPPPPPNCAACELIVYVCLHASNVPDMRSLWQMRHGSTATTGCSSPPVRSFTSSSFLIVHLDE
jgi:hypothetical protein